MVGGGKVLLSLAVLTGVGVDTVLGGLLRHRDGSYGRSKGRSLGVRWASGERGLSQPPVAEVATAPSAAAATATAATAAAAADEGTAAVVTETEAEEESTTTTTATTRRPTGPPQFTVSPVSVTKEIATTIDLGQGQGGGEGPGDAGDAMPTSSTEEYIYPGMYGSGGTLTTDSEAPTRSVVATRNSLVPNLTTARGPPPMDTSPPRTIVVETSIDLDPGSGHTYGPEEGVVSTPAATPATTVRVGPPGGGPPKPSTTNVFIETTHSLDLGYGSATTTTSVRTDGNPYSYPVNSAISQTESESLLSSSAPAPTVSASYCQPSDLTAAQTQTVWSVVHTSTITWWGNPEDYTPPFEPLSTPAPAPPCITPVSPPRLTISWCSSTGTGSKYVTCDVTTSVDSWGFITNMPLTSVAQTTVTLLTTDKNPAVVYTTIRTPNYGITQEPQTRDTHNTASDVIPVSSAPLYQSQPASQAYSFSPSARPAPSPSPSPTPTPIVVVVQPTAVVIGGNTITDIVSATQVVVISSQTFTIDPTRVVGGGATIDRPSATGGGVFVPVPTATTLAGVGVTVSSNVAVVGGTSYTFGPNPVLATVSGQTFTIGPTAVAVASQTMTLPTRPAPTEVVVAGGELVTAIGQSVVVIRGTTITYGPASDPLTTTIGDDIIVVGPSGATAHSTTFGGPRAGASETRFAVVGGATLTRIGASVVVIRSVTYTVGPGTGTTTTVVGGQTVVVAPEGVTVDTMSLQWPFGATTTIVPGATAPPTGAAATVSTKGEEDGAVVGRQPRLEWVVAVGVGVVGCLLWL